MELKFQGTTSNSDNQRIANLVNGPYFPFALPQRSVQDYGAALDDVFLPAVGRAYEREFPNRKFYNHRRGTLAGQVSVMDSSRHDRFLAALSKGPVFGVYFPALQGFSIPAAEEQMGSLPDQFLLASVLDTAAVEMMYPGEVARNYHTPGLECAVVLVQDS